MDTETQNKLAISETEKNKIRALVVDDDRVMRMLMSGHLEDLGCIVTEAKNGKEAVSMLEGGDVADFVLLDREMPEMTGIKVLEHMKSTPKLRRIPTIMVTGSTSPEQIKQGIDAGAFYYLTKPIDESVLVSVVTAAIRDVQQRKILSNELKKHKASFNLLHSCTFYLRSLDEAESLSAFLANCFPDTDRVLPGLAELIINAVEHGNLAITYDEKSELVAAGKWREEIVRRLELPEYKERKVEVNFQRNDNELSVCIEDMGEGFNWKKYLDIDPSRATDNHGRGIAQARAISFDEVIFNSKGNKVTAIIKNEEAIQW